MIDRTLAPEFKIPESFRIKDSVRETLSNGIPVWIVNSGDQDLVRIDFIFPAGKWFELQKCVAYF